MLVSGGAMYVKLNNKEGPYFVSYKEVRQGILYPQSSLILLLIVFLEWSNKHKEIICCVV